MPSSRTGLLSPGGALVEPLPSSSTLTLLLPYLSRCLAERRLGRPPACEVFGELLEGTLLFADITGFTALSEQLAQSGREGSEELTFLLNDYFEAMVDLVADHGGDVLQFGGDSLLAVFGAAAAAPLAEAARGDERQDGGRPPTTAAVLDAVHCGVQMQSVIQRFAHIRTSAGTSRLCMSIAVHCGPFLLASAGSCAGQLQQVVMGHTLNRLAAVEAFARPGEVLVTSEAARWLGNRVRTGDSRDGCFPVVALAPAAESSPANADSRARKMRLDAPHPFAQPELPATGELLRPYLIPAVYRRLVDDPAGFGNEGEHRFIATMFVNFNETAGLLRTLGEDRLADAVRLLDAYLATMTGAIVSHGGALARVSADVCGDKLLVVFGAPLAVENPGERALECALEMNGRLRELNATFPAALEQRIGICCGSAFCGNVGSNRRREYTVIADPVNTAARLMLEADAAEILVSASVWEQARESFDFEHRGPIHVKGKEHAVDVYRLTSSRRRSASRAHWIQTLVGREAECERFRQIVSRVNDGHGQFVTVSGPAGIGKSRLTEAFIAECRAVGMTGFRGECLAAGQSHPYHVWADILRDLAGISHDDAASVAQAKLAAQVAEISPELVVSRSLLGDVLGMSLRDNDHTASLPPRQRKEKIFEICLELLRAQARQCPTFLVLEDVHWIDPLSRELLDELSSRVAETPLLIVVTHRPDFEMPDPGAAGHACRIELGPLSTTSTADMLRVLLGGRPAPARLTHLVLERAQGNPFYVEELVRSLLGSGHLARGLTDDRYEFACDSGAVDLPGTIQGLILSRIDRLPQEHRRILQTSSVFGRAFPRDAVRRVLPFRMAPDSLQSRLDEMARLELIVPDLQAASPSSAGTYAFRHALIQEAVYESLSYARRREIHRAIGEELEQAGGADVEEQVPLLARHFDLARVPDKALTYLAAAGDKAKRAYANTAAADYYQRALVHARALGEGVPPQRLVPLLESLGDVLSLDGDYAAAVDRYDEALMRADGPVDRARLEGKIGGVCYRQGQPRTGIERLESGLAHLGIRVPRTRWQVRASLVRQVVIQAAHAIFPRWLVRERSRNVAATRAAIEIYEALSRISFESNLDRTLDAHLRQLNLCETLPGSPEMAQTYSSHGIVCGTVPLFGRALRYQRKGLAIREARSDRWGVAQSSNFMGVCYYWMGRWNDARACVERSARIFDEVGDRWETEVTHLILSFIALRRGELQQSVEHARTSLELSRRADDAQGMGWALGALAEACSRQGELEQALAHARQALACSQEARDGMYLAVVRRILGEIHLRRGDAKRAITELEGSVQQIRGERLRHEYVVGAYAALAEAALAQLNDGPVQPAAARHRSLAEIRKLCRTAVGRARKFVNWLPAACRVSALCEWAAGRPGAAQRFFERSLDVADELGARYELALTWCEVGRFLSAAGSPDARECLAEARRLFDDCGAVLDRNRAEALTWEVPVRIESGHGRVRAPHLLPGRVRRKRRFPGRIFSRSVAPHAADAFALPPANSGIRSTET